jgi:hypothetical protein
MDESEALAGLNGEGFGVVGHKSRLSAGCLRVPSNNTSGTGGSTPGLASVHFGTCDPTLVEPSLDAARSELGLGGRQLF